MRAIFLAGPIIVGGFYLWSAGRHFPEPWPLSPASGGKGGPER